MGGEIGKPLVFRCHGCTSEFQLESKNTGDFSFESSFKFIGTYDDEGNYKTIKEIDTGFKEHFNKKEI